VAVSSPSSGVAVYETSTGNVITTVSIQAVALAYGNDQLAAVTASGQVTIWDANTLQQVAQFQSTAGATHLILTSSYLLVGSNTGVELRDANTRQLIQTFATSMVDMDVQGDLLAVTTAAETQIYNLQTRQMVSRLGRAGGQVQFASGLYIFDGTGNWYFYR
jgi:hypothetical protein